MPSGIDHNTHNGHPRQCTPPFIRRLMLLCCESSTHLRSRNEVLVVPRPVHGIHLPEVSLQDATRLQPRAKVFEVYLRRGILDRAVLFVVLCLRYLRLESLGLLTGHRQSLCHVCHGYCWLLLLLLLLLLPLAAVQEETLSLPPLSLFYLLWVSLGLPSGLPPFFLSSLND